MSTISILRIKRKRKGEALDALVIQEAQPHSKRPRNDPAPPSNRGIFRFAETVPLDSFDTDTKTRLVRDRISAFLSHPPHALSRVSSSAALRSTASSPTVLASPARKQPSSTLRRTVDPAPTTITKTKLQERVEGFHQESKRSRYRIIERRREEELTAWEIKRGPIPPKVLTASEMRATPPREEMKIYDAVEESDSRVNILPNRDGTTDEATNQFVSMLEEYLTLQERSPLAGSPPMASVPHSAETISAAEIPEEDNDDFVYDVYYRDATAVIPGLAADGNDVSSALGLQRIGELAGLEEGENILSVELDSEEEDEADQDSNEENDYRNDYPEEEGSDDEYQDDEEY